MPRPGSTGPTCNGTCPVTVCRACYYSSEEQTCPGECSYKCEEDPSSNCFKKWGQCVNRRLSKKVSLDHYMHVLCTVSLRSFLALGDWCLLNFFMVTLYVYHCACDSSTYFPLSLAGRGMICSSVWIQVTAELLSNRCQPVTTPTLNLILYIYICAT